jgi:hypothetical protein
MGNRMSYLRADGGFCSEIRGLRGLHFPLLWQLTSSPTTTESVAMDSKGNQLRRPKASWSL